MPDTNTPAASAVIRRATPADAEAITGLIYELAEYEKARHECTVVPAQIEAALFGPAPAAFAHVVDFVEESVEFRARYEVAAFLGQEFGGIAREGFRRIARRESFNPVVERHGSPFATNSVSSEALMIVLRNR